MNFSSIHLLTGNDISALVVDNNVTAYLATIWLITHSYTYVYSRTSSQHDNVSLNYWKTDIQEMAPGVTVWVTSVNS